ncbi:unnamed protein product [Bursaphelenchus xylophilus]|uniref:(pine wood nematode) hypothetical protein n=1 Tax=Bursaphelenchus xylophilus TaxID=6326 RepID=A0A7I8X4G5_BURXY|nr:unnamed protein product [Bursaphelenchus xylophilus]CAG9128458.1 unnamed protein product [Bursaphelenchus xylophilus]
MGENKEKHEQLLKEEGKIVQKGLEVTKQLLKWYDERVDSLEKRKRMLKKGMVALDSAVHEQKLNFQRAQITALNRRMCALMTSSEKGFPSHENIRNPVKPPENGNYTSVDQPANTALQLLKQNRKLAEELEAKSQQIELLQREKRLQELKDIEKRRGDSKSSALPNYVHRPAALVRPAMAKQNYSQLPIKVHDTLL